MGCKGFMHVAGWVFMSEQVVERARLSGIGNSSGLGEVRRQELYASYDVLGVEGHNVMVLDDP